MSVDRKRFTVDAIVRQQITFRVGLAVECRRKGERRFGTIILMDSDGAWVRGAIADKDNNHVKSAGYFIWTQMRPMRGLFVW